MIAPGHLLHPRQACIWQAFTVARRLLTRRHDIRASFAVTWEAIQRDPSVLKQLWGPVRRLHQAVTELPAIWCEPFCIVTEHNVRLHLFQGSFSQWKHDLRHALRVMVWVSDRAFLNRLDMQGAGVIAYDATVSLLRRSERPMRRKRYKQCAPLSFFEQTHLRAILTGAVRTNEKLFKAQSCASPTCIHCDSDVIESVEHLFWQCPAWDQSRARFLQNFGNHLVSAPNCTRCCGILSQDVVDRGILSQREAVVFCENLQKCMVSVLCAREKALRKTVQVTVQATGLEAVSGAVRGFSDRERLYPGYPWAFELSENNCTTFFNGVPPRNWRVYKRGSSWSFGVQLFEPLIFYWKRLLWPQSGESQETISWAELAIDFYAATHCSVAPPGQVAPPTCEAAARFFASASKRMAAICGSPLVPTCEGQNTFATHVPSLTSLGLGRCAGLRLRPHLLCPSVVHQFLFQAARDGESSAEKHKRSFLLQIDHLPPPLWRVAKLHRRIVGKQSFNLVVAPKPKRVVHSHKKEIRHVVWTPEEVSEFQDESHWRDRQRIQKRLLHNRDALGKGKHFVLPHGEGEPAVCRVCGRSNISLSKFLRESCGGSVDKDALPSNPRVARDSVRLQKHAKLVNDHNLNRGDKHRLCVPTRISDVPKCADCGAEHVHGWRRFGKLIKQVCPMSL